MLSQQNNLPKHIVVVTIFVKVKTWIILADKFEFTLREI